MTDTRTLPELVAERRTELGLSFRQAAEKSGGLISSSHFRALEVGHHVNVSDRVLDGLSQALSVPISTLRRAAGLTGRSLPPFDWPKRANRLTARERKLVLELIDTLLAAHRTHE